MRGVAEAREVADREVFPALLAFKSKLTVAGTGVLVATEDGASALLDTGCDLLDVAVPVVAELLPRTGFFIDANVEASAATPTAVFEAAVGSTAGAKVTALDATGGTSAGVDTAALEPLETADCVLVAVCCLRFFFSFAVAADFLLS